MAGKIHLVRGDTAPTLKVSLTDRVTGDPVDLSATATVVQLRFWRVGADALTATLTGTKLVGWEDPYGELQTAAPYNVAGKGGLVEFSWTGGALAGDPGDYEGEIGVTYADAMVQTVYDRLRFHVRDSAGWVEVAPGVSVPPGTDVSGLTVVPTGGLAARTLADVAADAATGGTVGVSLSLEVDRALAAEADISAAITAETARATAAEAALGADITAKAGVALIQQGTNSVASLGTLVIAPGGAATLNATGTLIIPAVSGGVALIQQGTHAVGPGGTLVVGSGASLDALGTLTVPATISGTRSLAMTLVGAPLAAAQGYDFVFTQSGTVSSTGAFGYCGTSPTATMTLVVATVNSGNTVSTQGTVTINTGGTVTMPAFGTKAITAGDRWRVTTQATADATGGNISFGWPFVTP